MELKVVTLNKESFKRNSLELGSRIVNSNWKPDLIIGIKTGGVYVSRYIKEIEMYHDCEYNEVLLQRKGTKMKKKVNISNYLKYLPYSILNIMRVMEAKHIEKNYIKNKSKYNKSKNNENITISSELKNQIKKSTNLLIIDDAVDSGKTMLNMKDYLLNLNKYLVIKTAAITVTFEDPLITPDYYLKKRVLIRFPWSNDYKGIDSFE